MSANIQKICLETSNKVKEETGATRCGVIIFSTTNNDFSTLDIYAGQHTKEEVGGFLNIILNSLNNFGKKETIH